MRYKSYIFDLYGTLADIRTDEESLGLWTRLAALYSAWGADLSPAALRAAFRKTEREERRRLGKALGTAYPEIRLERVFARLLDEAPRTHPTSAPVGPRSGTERILESGWAAFAANLFRILSREKLRLYPGTREVLSALREAGRGIYLLSNAQAVFSRPEIEQLGLPPYFDGMSLSSDEGRMKPDPEFMEGLLAKRGLDRRECVMVGNDFSSDAASALACGMDCVILNNAKRPGPETEKLKAKALEGFPSAPADRIRVLPGIRDLLRDLP